MYCFLIMFLMCWITIYFGCERWNRFTKCHTWITRFEKSGFSLISILTIEIFSKYVFNFFLYINFGLKRNIFYIKTQIHTHTQYIYLEKNVFFLFFNCSWFYIFAHLLFIDGTMMWHVVQKLIWVPLILFWMNLCKSTFCLVLFLTQLLYTQVG